MATRIYTRGTSPQNPDQLAAHILTDTGKVVTVEYNSSNVFLTGSIVSGDDTTLQNSINTYIYSYMPGDLTSPTIYVDDGSMSSQNVYKAASQKQSYLADIINYNLANTKTAVRFWDAGTFQNGTPNTGDMIIFTDNTTVAGGAGNGTFYLTSDHTSSGTALCSIILVNSVRGGWVDSTGNYNSGLPTVTSNKTIVIPSTKQGGTTVSLLSVNVLTTITYPGSPNGTVVTLFAIGISV